MNPMNKNIKHKQKSRLLIVNNFEVLVLVKKGSKKRFGLVGGFLKKHETPEKAIIRETLEEVGVALDYYDLQYISTTNMIYKNEYKLTKHYFLLKNIKNTFSVCEPHKFKGLEWVNWAKACDYLGPSDKNALERFFAIQKGSIN